MLDQLLATEEETYQRFEAALLDVLRKPRRVQGSATLTLTEYLATNPQGDERPVVDPLVDELLRTLGYETAHIVYNESLLRGFPDYQVRLAEVPGNTVFIVEDKATNVTDFTAARGDESESPLAQLQRYVLASGSYAHLGLLCNGRVLEGWEIGSGERHLLFRLDLAHLASGAEPREADRETLRALFRRCGRIFFTRAESLLEDAVRAVRLSEEDVRAIWEECAAGRDLDRLRGARVRRMEAIWRQAAVSARDHADKVVETLEALIHLLEADVRGALEAALASAAEATRQLEALPFELPADFLTRLRLHRGLFDLDEARYDEALVLPLQRYFEDPTRQEAAALLDGLRAALRPHLRRGAELASAGAGNLDLFGAAPAADKRPAAAQRDLREKALEAVLRLGHDAILKADEVQARRREIEGSYRNAMVAAANFDTWRRLVSSSVLTGESDEALRREFARQTAYVYVIRLLLVRICEDKGVLSRKLSDGALVEWQEDARRYLDYASGRSHDYLCQMAYECAANLYAHFFASATLFDWYRLDEKLLLRAILALNTFRFDEVADDLIGTAYSNYLRAGKHAQGRYYTRRPVVETMLDELGYRGGAVVAGRLGDFACGSGSFLVGAARRIIDAYRDASGRVPDDKAADVLQLLVDNLHGVDLNPFACYLAETNLLIQSLDLLVAAERAGQGRRIERFHVYCADALVIDPHARPDLGAHLGALPPEARAAEAMKARLGDYKAGFEFLIGNPPYVRADDGSPSLGRFREAVEESRLYECLAGRWDLYVPFVELYARLLADSGRACMITIESIGNAPYAARLREKLCSDWTLERLIFADKLKLFPDAPWQSNRIFVFGAGKPAAGHRIKRLRASTADEDHLAVEPIDEIALDAGATRAFSLREAVDLDTSNCVPLRQICYVAYGMRLNATDKHKAGDAVEVPSNFAAEGWERVDATHARFQPFVKENVVSDARDTRHPRPFIDSGDDLALHGGFESYHWLEYGDHGRIPRFAYRPTFPELYDREKLIVGGFTGAAWDDGAREGHFCTSHSVTLALRWCDLAGVERSVITEAVGEAGQARDELETLSAGFSLGYLLALYVSAPIQAWLVANRRSMKDHVYPEDLKAIPIPSLPAAEQAPFIAHARRLQAISWRLFDLRNEGVRVTGTGKVTVPAATWTRRVLDAEGLPHVNLFQASAILFELAAAHAHVPLAGARARGETVVVGKEVVAHVRPAIPDPEPVARWLAAVLSEVDGTFASVQREVQVPRDRAGIARVLAAIAATEAEVRALLDERRAIRADIDQRAWALYKRTPPSVDGVA